MNPHRTPGVVIVHRDIKPENIRRGDLGWAIIAVLNGAAALLAAQAGNAAALWLLTSCVAINVSMAWPRIKTSAAGEPVMGVTGAGAPNLSPKEE